MMIYGRNVTRHPAVIKRTRDTKYGGKHAAPQTAMSSNIR